MSKNGSGMRRKERAQLVDSVFIFFLTPIIYEISNCAHPLELAQQRHAWGCDLLLWLRRGLFSSR